MRNDYFKTIMDNTRTAADQWNEFAAKCGDVEAFKKAFHLRPTADKDKMTIVSTLKHKPMRGAYTKDTEIAKFLKDLYNQELYKEGLDYNTIEARKAVLTEMGFKEASRLKNKVHEWKLQANMINAMSGDSALRSFLKVENLTFIASEFILSPKSDQEKNLKGRKVDIVGYDGLNKIFFFELKTPENKEGNPVKQVSEYLERYSSEIKEQTIAVLSNYPINSIKTGDVKFHGYVVYGYSDNLDTANSKPFHEGEPGEIYFK